MLSFHGDPKIRAALLDKLRAHAAADEIVKGQYWQDGKGCAVGCAIEGSDHALYESEFGIPVALARLEDVIFEGLPNADAKEFPVAFIEAIPVGVDLSLVQWRFLHWILTDSRANPGIDDPMVSKEVAAVADIMLRLSRGEVVPIEASESAEPAAWSAACSAAESAACSAAYAARSAAASAAESTDYAACSAAYAACSAAASAAASAARSAAASAAESAAESADWSADWSAAYTLMACNIIELLREAK